jgi:hypothetical protein
MVIAAVWLLQLPEWMETTSTNMRDGTSHAQIHCFPSRVRYLLELSRMYGCVHRKLLMHSFWKLIQQVHFAAHIHYIPNIRPFLPPSTLLNETNRS